MFAVNQFVNNMIYVRQAVSHCEACILHPLYTLTPLFGQKGVKKVKGDNKRTTLDL